MEIDYRKIGRRLRATRKQHNLSQGQLAELVGVGSSHISHIESGHTKVSVQVLVDICNALDISADELLCGHIYQAKAVLVDEAAALLAACGARELETLLAMLRLVRLSVYIVERNNRK